MTVPSDDASRRNASPDGVEWGRAAGPAGAVSERLSSPNEPVAGCTLSVGGGVCVVDRSGEIVAADLALSTWMAGSGRTQTATINRLERLIEGPELAHLLTRVFQGEAEARLSARRTGAPPTEAPLTVRMRLLAGADGPLALVEIQGEPVPRTPVRLDPLTQLSDRQAISQRVESWRQEAAPQDPRFAVLFLDLDGFKRINDSFGHPTGDAVLQTLAVRWLGCVRDGDLVARYGGDEFVALVKDASTAEEVDPVVRRLSVATNEPIVVGGQRLQMAVTIGVAIADSSDAAVGTLVAAADRDMYSRKRAART